MKKSNLLNSPDQYGWGSILLHWSMAIALIGMYLLGDYMVDLNYYDAWYHKAPALHKATGIVIALVLIFRWVWNVSQHKPVPLERNPRLIMLAKFGHLTLYLLIILLVVSGYLISTAKGQGIDVFGIFKFPALLADNADRGEIAGSLHAFIATFFMLMVVLHAIAALIHHFIFKDRTLQRMLWVKK